MTRRLLSLLVLGMASAAAGCGKPLFPEGTTRSPYERYMALRGQAAPAVEDDAFGREQPALRQRLRPMDAP